MKAPSPWLFLAAPLVFLLHDLEELLRLPEFLEQNAGLYPAGLDWLLPSPSDFSLSIALIFLASQALALAAWRAGGAWWTGFALLCAARLWNTASHLGQGAVLDTYVPGLVSAVFLVLPFSLYLLARLRRSGLLSGRALRIALAAGLPLMPLSALFFLAAGKALGGLLP